MKRILIVGGTGFIGFNLCKVCLKLKMHVTSLSSKQPNRLKRLKKVHYLVGDISNYNKIRSILINDYEYVVNLGGNIDHKNKTKTYKNHFLAVKNLYKIFKNKKIKKFIQIGSSSEYGKFEGAVSETTKCKPEQAYGKSKHKATSFLIKKFKLNRFPVTILRFFQIYGPYQKPNRLIPFVICSSIKNKIFSCSEGGQYRDFLYISDAIKSIIKSLKNKKILGKVINVGYGKPIEVKKIILQINNLINKGKPIFGKVNLRADESNIIYPNLTRSKKYLILGKKKNILDGLKETIKFYKKNINKY